MAIGGFDELRDTFSVNVARAEGRPLNVPLVAPFTIASSRLDTVGNVALRVELRCGSVGWGGPVLPSVTAEDQPTALAAASAVCDFLTHSPPMALGPLLEEIASHLPGHDFASIRAGIEMALIDAVANSIHIPLWTLFGGASRSLITDITIPIVAPKEAAELAAKYKKRGFNILKLKVGKNLSSDIEVLSAIRQVHPFCRFILDANEGYTTNEAIEVLEKLNDESCRGLDDAKRIIDGNLAHVINIKLAKLGVLGALDVIEVARAAGTELMIGGMVETRLAMGFAGHLAAGLGCFKYVDLDTPLLLSDDPVIGGYEVSSLPGLNQETCDGYPSHLFLCVRIASTRRFQIVGGNHVIMLKNSVVCCVELAHQFQRGVSTGGAELDVMPRI
ncbi:hypothetical protein HPP92_008863 [Vanilla planifolia]|nr:hypothetical protein HPP92_008863 [Vanilla planifolia]